MSTRFQNFSCVLAISYLLLTRVSLADPKSRASRQTREAVLIDTTKDFHFTSSSGLNLREARRQRTKYFTH